MGHGQVMDSMFLDGTGRRYEGGLMGVFAQRTADEFNITREAMDEFAIGSLQKSLAAIENGWFRDEIVPVTVSVVVVIPKSTSTNNRAMRNPRKSPS